MIDLRMSAAWHAALSLCVATWISLGAPAQEKKPRPKPAAKPRVGEVLLINEVRAIFGEPLLLGERLRPLNALDLAPEDARPVFDAWVQNKAADVLERAAAMIRDNPTDHRGYALRYLTELRLVKDRKAAHQTATLAAGSLRKQPKQLVAFVENALFVDATIAEYRIAVMTLAPLVPDHTHDALVRVAHLRALAGAGKIREAVVTNKNIVADLKDDAKGLLALAQTICEMQNGRALAGVGKKALDLAEKTLPADQNLLKVKYRLLHDLLGLHKEAHEVGERIVQPIAMGTDLNNFVWYLMEESQDQGKYPALALIGARRMLTAETIDVNEWDTIALAFHRNHLFDKAIEYQRRALAMPGATSAYRQRMAMYERAKAAADRKAAAKDRDGGKRDR